MEKEAEIYGKYYCKRAESDPNRSGVDERGAYYECIYHVIYREEEVEKINEQYYNVGDYYTEQEVEIEYIDCEIRNTDDDENNLFIYDYRPNEAAKEFILNEIKPN